MRSFGVRNAPFGTDVRHLEASQLPSLQFWPGVEDRSGCSCVSSEGLNELACDESALGNGARNSFAVSSIWKILSLLCPRYLRWLCHFVVPIVFVLTFIGSP